MDLVLTNPHRSGCRTSTELVKATRVGWKLSVTSHRSVPCRRSWRGFPRGKGRMEIFVGDGFPTRKNRILG